MSLLCFVCQKAFAECNFLFSHLKIYHNLLPNDTYICGYENCKKIFSSFKAFSKHIRKETSKNGTGKEICNTVQPISNK